MRTCPLAFPLPHWGFHPKWATCLILMKYLIGFFTRPIIFLDFMVPTGITPQTPLTSPSLNGPSRISVECNYEDSAKNVCSAEWLHFKSNNCWWYFFWRLVCGSPLLAPFLLLQSQMECNIPVGKPASTKKAVVLRFT